MRDLLENSLIVLSAHNAAAINSAVQQTTAPTLPVAAPVSTAAVDEVIRGIALACGLALLAALGIVLALNGA